MGSFIGSLSDRLKDSRTAYCLTRRPDAVIHLGANGSNKPFVFIKASNLTRGFLFLTTRQLILL